MKIASVYGTIDKILLCNMCFYLCFRYLQKSRNYRRFSVCSVLQGNLDDLLDPEERKPRYVFFKEYFKCTGMDISKNFSTRQALSILEK